MQNTWIVVADSGRARFFACTAKHEPLNEFDGMVHLESRMRESDELSDRQGGIAGGHGEGDHTFEAPTDHKYHEAENFARQIAGKLEHGRVNREYKALILIAAPAFLGILRQTVDSHVLNMVSNSLDKNLVAESEEVIREHLFSGL